MACLSRACFSDLPEREGASIDYSLTAENWLSGSNGYNYHYDGLQRMRMVNQTSWASYRMLAYDGADMFLEYEGQAISRRYVHGPGVDEPLVWYEGTGTTDRRFLHADERGSIVAVTNSAGSAMDLNLYDEYGRPSVNNIGRFQYTGQTYMGEAGLYYYKARWYNPRVPVFLQSDPIGYGDGMNLYAYVGGDPVNSTDPSGLGKFVGVHPNPIRLNPNEPSIDENDGPGQLVIITGTRELPLSWHDQQFSRDILASMFGQSTGFHNSEGGGGGGGGTPGSGQDDPVCPAVPASRPVGRMGQYGAATRHPLGALAANEAANVANSMAAKRFPNLNGHNDARDAYRHFYWSYAMTRLLGPNRARAFANAHEAHYPNNPVREQAMDTWNNEVAIAMATDPRNAGLPTANAAEKAMTNGCLRRFR